MVTNEHQYVTKMALSASMGGLWGNFTAIFWIAKYLQRSIYIWNKVSKHIMSQCGMDFQSTSLLYHAILNILNQFNMLMVYLGFRLLYKSMIPKLT
jgi:hypothetical protein